MEELNNTIIENMELEEDEEQMEKEEVTVT